MDSEFIQKVLDGDSYAYRFFIEKYRDMAYSLAVSVVKDEFTAADVVQEAFLKAFENLNKMMVIEPRGEQSDQYKEAYESWKWALDICLKNSAEK